MLIKPEGFTSAAISSLGIGITSRALNELSVMNADIPGIFLIGIGESHPR
jgi:hypothetical protein